MTIEHQSTRWRQAVTHPSEGKHPGFGHRVEEDERFHVERDVAVAMRDGIRLYVDIIRPKGNGPFPVILTFSPYGKHGLKKFLLNGGSGVPEGWVSKYAVWEGPDPDYFCRHGYAVVNADARGSWYSEGDMTIWSEQEAQDGHDLIEWCAAQPWSTGKVGMSGVSYLSIVQWRIAATNPPHLAAFNPWEGWTDCYRERAYHGGIPETNMVRWAQWSTSFSLTRSEEFVEMAKEFPLDNAYWRSKSANLSAITAPVYIVAGWGDQGLHLRGSVEGYKQIASEHKWLEIHGRKKWQYYYQESSREKLRKFFDHFLKNSDDQVLGWPRVLYEAREKYYVGEYLPAADWPLPDRQLRPLWLDASRRKLGDVPPTEVATAPYDSANGELSFTYTFTERTEVTGNMKLRIWLQSPDSTDADVFVGVRKLDANGQKIGLAFMAEYDDGPVALGWLRASHRKLDTRRSSPEQPWHSHDAEQLLQPGEVVPLDIELWPSSTVYEAGEQLQLVIQGQDIYVYPGVRHGQVHDELRNQGPHVIHAGCARDSHLLIPVIPRAPSRTALN
ncbi:Cocaine esterase [Pigmentiphaga humi]|uniref:Cocaine esterase n=1 Tax=Pigmentiphaga humi TaxID=2478468 RepID=A0A3P4B845_9BURK|nr:Cocaine esterase [Pigmentiphaga humi]